MDVPHAVKSKQTITAFELDLQYDVVSLYYFALAAVSKFHSNRVAKASTHGGIPNAVGSSSLISSLVIPAG